jgi:hypothetical protein
MVEIDGRMIWREVIGPASLALLFMGLLLAIYAVILIPFEGNISDLVGVKELFWCWVMIPTMALLIALRGRI